MKSQRIPKNITIDDLVIFAESIGCIVDIRFTDKPRPTKPAPDARKSGAKKVTSKTKKAVNPARG